MGLPIIVGPMQRVATQGGLAPACGQRQRPRFDMNYSRTLLAASTVLALLPWINRAYFIDDPLFLWNAEQIQKAPTDYYGGRLNWGGTVAPMVEPIQNPPAVSYYLALVASITGFGEMPMHLAMLVPAVAASLGLYSIAQRLTNAPLLASAIGLVTPVFLLSATAVMCDVAMLAFWVWSIALWIKGLDENKARDLAVAGLLMGCCGLTKYFGVALLPLAFVYGCVRLRGPGRWCLWLLIPLAMFTAYELYSHALYGRYLILGAASYAAETSAEQESGWLNRGLLALVYTGAGVAPVALWMPWLWSWRTNLVWALATVGLGVAIGTLENLEGAPLHSPQGIAWNFLLHLTLFASLGVQVVALTAVDAWRSRDASSLLLGLWVAGTLAFAAWFNWTISGRTVLPLAPVVGLLVVRRLSARAEVPSTPLAFRRPWGIPLAAGLALSTLLCWSDASTAQHEKEAALNLAAKHRRSDANTLLFEGHWGFQYYLERAGAQCVDYYASDIVPGDVILVQNDNAGVNLTPKVWQVIEVLDSPVPSWITTNSRDAITSFYSHIMGPLPYCFGRVPPRRYVVFLARERYTFQPRK